MIDEKKLDDKIARLVRSVELEVPAGMDAKIRDAAAHLKPAPRTFKIRRPIWLALIPSAAAVLLAVIALLPTPQKPPSPISEIRTEFDIVDKNIKIIFIQKPDFNLFKEN